MHMDRQKPTPSIEKFSEKIQKQKPTINLVHKHAACSVYM